VFSLVDDYSFEHAIGYDSGGDVVLTGAYQLMDSLKAFRDSWRGLEGLSRSGVMHVRISGAAIHCVL
jgi:hypothetical protein